VKSPRGNFDRHFPRRLPSEDFMHDYEIRILAPGKDRGRRGHTIIEVMHLNDSTAIRAARSLAAGRPFEVWRGIERIDFEQLPRPGTF
jgi:hypothetical protein